MKLSKQERIGLMIIIAVVILALGGFLMFKPKVEETIRNKETMETKQKDYDDKKAKADTNSTLRTQIMEAYENGIHTADMFFTEMDGYEVDDMFREFLENREYTKPGEDKPQSQAKVLVEELQISEISAETITPSFTTTVPITYPLKEFATQGGVTLSEKEAAAVLRKATLQSILSEQTIGATTISFAAKAVSNDELIKFADEINNFTRDENGSSVRKAMMTKNISLVYNDVTKKYEDLVEEANKEAESEGKDVFHQVTGLNPSDGSSSNIPTPLPDGDNDGEQKSNVSNFISTWENTLMLYSVERMQNPQSILDAQDDLLRQQGLLN